MRDGGKQILKYAVKKTSLLAPFSSVSKIAILVSLKTNHEYVKKKTHNLALSRTTGS